MLNTKGKCYISTSGTGSITNTGAIQATGSNSSVSLATSGTGILTNSGTILASNGSTATISGTLASAGLGTVTASGTNTKLIINSALTLPNQINGLTESGGASIYFQGNVSNAGNTFDVASLTGANNVNGQLILNGGTFSGGTINNASLLSFGSSLSTVLDGVTLGSGNGLNLNGPTTTNYAYARIANSFSFTSGATFNVGTTIINGYQADLLFDSTAGNPNPTFNNATVNLGNGTNNGYGYLGFGNGYSSGNTLTLGSGLTIQGRGGVGYVNSNFAATGANLINNGIINADIASSSLNVSTNTNGNLTNNGTIEATASNSSIGVSTGGTGSITNAAGATIQATASGSSFSLNSGTGIGNTGIVLNNGTINATNGGRGSFLGTAFTNAGTLLVETGSTLTLSSTTSRQTAGTTIVNGALTVTNASSNLFMLTGGALYGTGAFTGTLGNAGGTVGAGIQGTSPTTGTLTLTGNFVESGDSIFSSALGGATQGSQYDYFSATGTATLAGRLNIDLLNNFSPTPGQSFQIIRATNGVSGSFNNVSNGTVADSSGHYFFQVMYATNSVTLSFQGSDLPEPSGAALLLTIGVPGGMIGLVARRRRINRETGSKSNRA